ncbi:MAG: hypothetical protein IPL78_25855 [Chloroflexi bacterium]|nr:hypothetical protein [Chloroflexota bacterium]
MAGLLLSLTTFFSLGNGALLIVLVVFALFHPHLKSSIVNRQSKIVHLKWLLWFAIGLASIWLIYWLGWGVPLWSVARVGLQQHYELVTSLRRYDWWVVYNLVDLLIFAGPIVVVGFAAACLTTIRRLILPQVATTELTNSPNLRQDTGLILALALLILALDLSGSARGEVGRLWLFFMPLLAVVSAGQLVSLSAFQFVSLSANQPPKLETRNSKLKTLPLLLAAHLILVLSLGAWWNRLRRVIVVSARPEMPTTAPGMNLRFLLGRRLS